MKQRSSPDLGQLGFDLLLAETDEVNQAAALDRATGHLPSSLEAALPHYRDLIARHHAAMLAGDGKTVGALREEAHRLALRLNHGEPGILPDPDAPGCKLADLTAAEAGTIPAWGQQGEFILELAGMRVFIKFSGLFGLGARFTPYLSFSAHALDCEWPFLSETGYRSFMGVNAALTPDLTPDACAREVIANHVATALKGKLVPIAHWYRPTATR
ncbi:hypothetical protein [Bosea sp. (in: a-proteobacteria)]|jgi:hypothetical protein|uniref:hypothetical protein n=1 Tax=Bosea sp. (in: a-proteobacteria) TaxID=1871050 RepID=UPI002DDD4F4D|nr:hypothetical protein [Bosea sp. (in: a-proteobacteria)]HEV2512630.1 hypothetical protein [Bosea sp. (in: a-proteobacteria)]